MDFSKIKPWNTGEFPVKINNIRFNQDHSLFTLATSRGYKIFSSRYLTKVQEETELVRDFGDLNIVMTYYRSNIVYFSARKNNPKISTKELIVFDDFTQTKISSFKSKEENIIDFYVSKNAILIALENKIVVLEILSMKAINIVENIEINNKLVTYNVNDIIAYTKQKMSGKIFIDIYSFKDHIINKIEKKIINSSFDFSQLIKISPSGNTIAVVSMLGNKVHIYNVGNNELVECILIGTQVNNIEKLSFLNRKEDYILVNINNGKLGLYYINNNIFKEGKCVCKKYSDDDILNGRIKLDNNFSFFDYFWVTKNHDIKEPHLTVPVPSKILFCDFFFVFKKSFVVIDKLGYYYIYFYIKEKTDKSPYYCSCKWV